VNAFVPGDPSDGPWVIRVAAEHVDTLAQLPDDVRPIAEPWAASDELEGADPADLAEVLRSLRAPARDARSSSQRLYCWISL
jgi:hypothetical protein